jgi:putative DNA-invertase from lambdoid prophage Rac
MENGDVLIVTKLDRLGRNAMDIRKTVEQLAALDIRVHCLALGGVDLTSPAGKMTMQVISAVAEFERDLLLERTYSGIARAKAAGKRFGRPHPERGTKANSDRAPKCWHQYQCYCPGI